jgi:predicted dehydrogenase
MDKPKRDPVKVLIVGCGAVVSEYQGPAAREAQRMGLIEVVGLVDHSEDRLSKCLDLFPKAETYANIEEAGSADLALIATPVRSHAEIATKLLHRGYHLLIEKPICLSLDELDVIRDEARRHERIIAVGHFRRFFPALETIRSFIASGVFGPVRRIIAEEGGQFRWPAASAGFFTKQDGGGGVTMDIGIHMFEMLISWLGTPEIIDYTDDAMGGVEINSAANLRWPSGAEAHIRLSWDVALSNRYRIEFERATITWCSGQATDLWIDFDGVSAPLLAASRLPSDRGAQYSLPANGYLAAFTAQWQDVATAIRQGRLPLVTSETAGAALLLVSNMYKQKRLLNMPYFESDELATARRLVEESSL